MHEIFFNEIKINKTNQIKFCRETCIAMFFYAILFLVGNKIILRAKKNSFILRVINVFLMKIACQFFIKRF